MYGPLYNKHHQFLILQSAINLRNAVGRKGFRSKLLCARCERMLAIYDDYAWKVVSNDSEMRRGNQSYEIRKVDYRKFKLFELSILWRAGISDHAFFENVVLEEHEEQLRQMILSENPGKSLSYPCLTIAMFHQGCAARNLVRKPHKYKMEGYDCYRFVFGGFLWVFFLTQALISDWISRVVLQEDGTLPLAFAESNEWDFVIKEWTYLAGAGKLVLPRRLKK